MTEPSSSDQPTPSAPVVAGEQASLQALRQAVLGAAATLLRAAGADEAPPTGKRGGITLERPPRADFGDYSTNAALLLAPRLGAPPREVAERLGAQLAEDLGASLRALRGRRPGLREPVRRRRLAARRRSPRVLAAGERLRRGRRRSRPSA